MNPLSSGLFQSQEMRQEMRINPRLYQSMELLYMPLLELQKHLESELEENPFLELTESDSGEDSDQKLSTESVASETSVEKNDWEIKDRHYFLLGDKEPLTFTLKSRHTEKYPLLYFDPIKKEQRALRYATNQSSPFADEQKGEVTLKHIMFKDGSLHVPQEYQALQKL